MFLKIQILGKAKIKILSSRNRICTQLDIIIPLSENRAQK